MSPAVYRSRLAPWAGWISAALAVTLNHQGLADVIYFDCSRGNPVSGVLVAALALLIAWTGALISWRSRHDGGEGPPEFRTRYFIAVIGMLFAALYSVTVVFQALATLIIPVCAR